MPKDIDTMKRNSNTPSYCDGFYHCLDRAFDDSLEDCQECLDGAIDSTKPGLVLYLVNRSEIHIVDED